MRASVRISSRGRRRIGVELRQAAERVEQLPREFVDLAAEVGPEMILDAVRARRGTLSMGKLGPLDVLAESSESAVVLKATPPGPWGMVDGGTKPHTIRPRRKRALDTPYGVFARVNHPGMDGIDAWEAGTEAVARELDKRVEETVSEALGD